MNSRLYWNRWLVYGTLLILGGMMLIDAFPRTTLLHVKAADAIDPMLDKIGLWQGSWMLFAPSPDHVNVRVMAKLTWDDNVETEWQQPEWYSMSPWEKSAYFRHMEFFDGLWVDRNDPAVWNAFCTYLARQHEGDTSDQEHPSRVVMIRLFQDRDVIAPPSQKLRKAYAEPEYSATYQLHTWYPDAR